jgi:hypothetical protein
MMRAELGKREMEYENSCSPKNRMYVDAAQNHAPKGDSERNEEVDGWAGLRERPEV